MAENTTINRQALVAAITLASDRRLVHPNSMMLKYPSLYSGGTIDRNGIAAAVIAEAMLKDPVLAGFDGGAIAAGGMLNGIRVHHLATWLWSQYRTSKDTLAVVDHLEKLLSRNSAPATTYLLLADIAVSEAITFTPTLSLLPIDEINTSKTFKRIRELRTHAAGLQRASAVLELRHVAEPLLFTKEQLNLNLTSTRYAAEQDRHEFLETIKYCIGLVGPCAPVGLAKWTEIDQADAPQPDDYGWYEDRGDRIFPIIPLGAFDGNQAKTLVQSLLSMSATTRSQLHVPLQRINRALRQENPVDCVIDLGIGLEALLLHNIDSPESLRYRFALRGAYFHAPAGQPRQSCFNQLRAIYDLRSAAVHKGTVPDTVKTLPGIKAVPTELFLATSLRLACALLAAVINRGGIPEWESMVLNGGRGAANL